jgi:L-ascorbate metabolism protein UlaG (beta-lactamase superfamily)
MTITWYGHAAFGIETCGKRIILDPYRSPDCGGYEPIGQRADIVVVSHENDRYHSHLGQIRSPFFLIRGLEIASGGVEVDGVRFEAIPCFETPEKLPGDEVTVLHIASEGPRVVFLGDLGHALSDSEIAPLRGAEVVLAAAGGPPTLDYPALREVLTAIGPRVVIPMHFKTPGIDLNILPVERFLEAMADWPVERPGSSTIALSREAIPAERRIILLEHAR